MKKENLDVDPQSMDNRRLGAIARNPNHPQATHAKAELARRKVKKAEMDEGGMKRIATTQSNKADRMASGGKKGLETFKKKVHEVSSKTLSNYMRKSAADAGKPRQSARTQDKRIGGQKMADDKLRKMDGKGSAAKVAATPSKTTRMRSKGWIRGMSRVEDVTMKKAAEADDATVRMYKDNPDMMKSKGPGGLKSLSKKAQKDVKKSMNKAAVNEVLDTPKAMQSYKDKAKYSKDKATNSAVANILRKGDHTDDLKTRAKRVKGLGMADRNATNKTAKALRKEESVNEISNKTLTRYAMSADNDVQKRRSNRPAGKGDESDPKIGKRLDKINLAHKKGAFKEESVNELSKDTMQSYWDKTKGDDAFSGTRKANNRLKGAINVTTKLDRIKKMIKKK